MKRGLVQNPEKKQLIGNEPTKKKEDPEQIKLQIEAFTRLKGHAASRKSRLEDLMKRRSANGWRSLRGRTMSGWSAEKKATMVRRYMTASQELEQAHEAIDQLTHRLSQITTEGQESDASLDAVVGST